MTIHPFLAGILLVIGIELLLFVGFVLHEAYKYYKQNLRGDK